MADDFSDLGTLEEVHEKIMNQMEAYQNDAPRALNKNNKAAAKRCRAAIQNLSKLKKPFKEMSMHIGK